MNGRGLQHVVRTLTARCGQPAAAALPDADLLWRFAAGGDAEAFAELHLRHGPLVWAACRSLVRNPADAEDAYQAMFLALVRSAPKVRNAAAVGAWLHGVAVRVGLKLRQRSARRRDREARAARREAEWPVADGSWERLLAAVHEEVERLPANLRAAFVLCDLQGVSQPGAARRLGWPLGSLSGRLSKARARVADRLLARGVAPAAAALGVAATGSEAGVVPGSLAAAVRLYAVSPGSAPAVVQSLAKEVMTMTQLKWAVAAVVAAGLATLGTGTMLVPTAGGQPPAAHDSDLPAAGVVDVFTGLPLSRNAYSPSSRYRYLPFDAGQTAEPLAATVTRLEFQAAQGWEFCGTVDMKLTVAEVAALRDVRAVPRDAPEAKRATHRVLVFRRSAGPAASINPVTGAVDATAAPAGMAPAPGTDATAPARAGGLPPPPLGTSAGGVGTPPLASGDPAAADGRPAGPAKAEGPPTVIYRAKVAAVETLEKVAVGLAKGGRRGAVTAIADPRTASLILTGEANAIKEIVERLQKLEDELGGPKPPSTPVP